MFSPPSAETDFQKETWPPSLPHLPSAGAVAGFREAVAGAEAEAPFALKIPHQCAKAVEGLTVQELCRSSAVYNVELSWLSFNWRVLSMACSPRVPLLEKLMCVR